MSVALHHGDCLEVMRGMAEASVDAVVTDPPYHLGPMARRLASADADDIERNFTKKVPGQGVSPYQKMARGFMGKQWDGGDIAFRPELWADVLRVLKPGGHLIAFSGTRTYHRMACAIEDAGFEIRDQIGWLYGSGFPKSHDISKALDRAAGVEREVVGVHRRHGGGSPVSGSMSGPLGTASDLPLTAPATDAAKQWEGWGTALKPAWEPICLARKPLTGTVAANVAAHGTGALNIDGCRVETGDDTERPSGYINYAGGKAKLAGNSGGHPSGRWPANVAHDGSDEVLEAFAEQSTRMGMHSAGHDRYQGKRGGYNASSYEIASNETTLFRYGDTGTAARFFYSAKATKAERGEGNSHPTVKPIALMRWLCRLVTPPGGTVLDPFAGSGSTLIAAAREGFSAIGIEREAEYVAIARRRLAEDAPLFSEVA